VMVSNIAERLSSAGHEVEISCLPPEELESEIGRAVRQHSDAVIIGGGDGTVCMAARQLVGGHTALGVIPLGTLNRLARDLDIPLEPDAAVRSLSGGNDKLIDVAEVNGRLFLCNSLIGLPLYVAEHRQRARGMSIAWRVRHYFNMARDVLRSVRRLRVKFADAAGAKAYRALSVVVSNNPYDEVPSLMLRRSRIDCGRLAVYLSLHDRGAGIIISLLRAMLGRWRHDPQVEQLDAAEFVLNVAGPSVKVSNDGEVEVFAPPLCYSVRPRALTVLVP